MAALREHGALNDGKTSLAEFVVATQKSLLLKVLSHQLFTKKADGREAALNEFVKGLRASRPEGPVRQFVCQ